MEIKMPDYSNIKIYILLILSLALLIRAFGINLSLYDDEGYHPTEAEWVGRGDYPVYMYHPPVSIYLNYINSKTGLPLRSMPLFFGMLTLVMTYLLAKEMYDEKIALLTLIIMTFSFYHVLSSLQHELNGGIVTFLMLWTFYYFVRYNETGATKKLNIAGILFGISLLTYYPTAIIAIVISFFVLIRPKYDAKKDLIKISRIFIIGLLLFSLFPISAYLMNRPDIFEATIKWAVSATPASARTSKDFNTSKNFILSFIKHSYRLVLFATPFLVIVPLFVWTKRENRYDDFLFLWVITTFLIFTFLIPGGNISRYFMSIIPPLCILTGKGLSKIRMNDIKIGILPLMASLVIVLGFNSWNSTRIPLTFSNISLDMLLKNPDIWLTSFSGPFFKVSSLSFILISVLSVLGMVLFFKSPSKMLIMLLALSLPMNIFMVNELFFYNFGPNYDRVVVDMTQYYLENKLPEPALGKHETFMHINEGNYFHPKERDKLKKFFAIGGTFMWLNLPPPIEGSFYSNMLKNIRSNCDLEKIFYSKGYEAGYIFICESH